MSVISGFPLKFWTENCERKRRTRDSARLSSWACWRVGEKSYPVSMVLGSCWSSFMYKPIIEIIQCWVMMFSSTTHCSYIRWCRIIRKQCLIVSSRYKRGIIIITCIIQQWILSKDHRKILIEKLLDNLGVSDMLGRHNHRTGRSLRY